ncbi:MULTISPECIES: hypothetical protein [Paenisporosarcina]|uniref:hypothetical protein n=1 Tax=Paenisporosarcina TaxID=651660 RepID=UPI0002D4BF68|nr:MULTISPECIES: hypothetical protein [Paenisporosarcina]
MATKSKSNAFHWVSIVSLAIGMLSLMYGYAYIQQLFEQGFFHSNPTMVRLARIFIGGV